MGGRDTFGACRDVSECDGVPYGEHVLGTDVIAISCVVDDEEVKSNRRRWCLMHSKHLQQAHGSFPTAQHSTAQLLSVTLSHHTTAARRTIELLPRRCLSRYTTCLLRRIASSNCVAVPGHALQNGLFLAVWPQRHVVRRILRKDPLPVEHQDQPLLVSG